MDIAPVALSGEQVRLEPLTPEHLPGMVAAGLDAEIWRWMPMLVATPEDMRAFVDDALAQQRAGTQLPFATVHARSGTVIGSTRFMNIERAHRRVEIGGTWLAPAWQRTAANTEAKYLMLRHAFETLGCMRVELKTDSRNERSRAAILRLGAREEGTLRNHMICHGGRIRHTVYYSIVDSEWPAVKRELERKLIV
jgi:RimJ/RimL family protein N-acetyltransferase